MVSSSSPDVIVANHGDKADDADHAAGNGTPRKPQFDYATSTTRPSKQQQSERSPQQLEGKTESITETSSFLTTQGKSKLTNQRPSLQRGRSSKNSSLNTSLRNIYNTTNQSFRTLRRQSSSLIESINSNLPATPTGWALSALSLCSAGLQHELRLQKELSAPPIVFCQACGSNGGNSSNQNVVINGVLNERMNRIYNKLSSTAAAASERQSKNNKKEGIFSRTVTPSLFIGTRGIVASAAAYAMGGKDKDSDQVKRVREVMKMGSDGALIVLDWEIPIVDHNNIDTEITKPNSITKPILLLLHGINNDSTFGYIRSMMRTATKRGWIAVCMNLRGQDGLHQVKFVTPRGYNAGYTGDLRGVVEQLDFRLKKRTGRGGRVSGRQGVGEYQGLGQYNNDDEDYNEDDDYIGGPIYLLGYSLGANIVTKYLGEESLHGTLPKCIGGGAAMGNPLHIRSGSIAFPWNVLLGAGVKRSILQNASSLRKHHDPGFQRAMKKALLAPTIGKLDDAAAPYLIRNDSHPPYATRIGFKDGEEYWWESSSHRYVGHVSVPLLKISAQDDFLVFGQFQKKLNHCLENPNVVVVKTRCGGHLGWQESPPPSSDDGSGGALLGRSGSWSDVAVADFIEALLQIRDEDREMRLKKRRKSQVQDEVGEGKELADTLTPPKIMSRL